MAGALRRSTRRWRAQSSPRWRTYIETANVTQTRLSIGSRRHSPRSMLVGLFVITLSVALSALAAEGIVRLVAPQPAVLFDEGLYIPDEATGHRHRPGYRGSLTNVVEFNTRVEINDVGLPGPPLRN